MGGAVVRVGDREDEPVEPVEGVVVRRHRGQEVVDLQPRLTHPGMTIADDQGVWLTLEEVELDWNRSALLRGRLEVQALTAKRLSVPRLPVAQEETLPDPEAKPFTFPAIPDLPVAIDVADFSVDEINLGAPILGEAATLTVQATALLNDDTATVDILAARTDGRACGRDSKPRRASAAKRSATHNDRPPG